MFSNEGREEVGSCGLRRKPQRLLNSARRNVTQRIIGRNKTYPPGCLMTSITGHLVSPTTLLYAPDLSPSASNDASPRRRSTSRITFRSRESRSFIAGNASAALLIRAMEVRRSRRKCLSDVLRTAKDYLLLPKTIYRSTTSAEVRRNNQIYAEHSLIVNFSFQYFAYMCVRVCESLPFIDCNLLKLISIELRELGFECAIRTDMPSRLRVFPSPAQSASQLRSAQPKSVCIPLYDILHDKA